MNISKLKLARVKTQEAIAILEKAGDSDTTAIEYMEMAEITIVEAITHAKLTEED